MNLIEELGSYEKAKAELEDKKWRRDNLHGSAEFTWHMKQHIELLEKFLLNYRREHRIFEVGDWVGIKDGSTNWVDKVVSIEYKKIYDSKWNTSEIEILIFEDGSRLGVGWAIHATDAEIQAGKRL